jgi:iron uptake system component EfeO
VRSTAKRRVELLGCLIVTAGLVGCGAADPESTGSRSTTAADRSTDDRSVSVTLTSQGCKAEPAKVSAGPLTFEVVNSDAAAVSELELLLDDRILGEKEGLAPGFKSSFSLDLGGGSYQLFCPGAITEYSDLVVTGKSANATSDTATLLQRGTVIYGKYVELQVDLLVDGATPLVKAIHAGDVQAAQRAYAKARTYYERIEPVAESFATGKVNLDARIDARAGDVPASAWTGFHPIEHGLFEDRSTKGLRNLAAGLQVDVRTLQSLVRGLEYQPAELLNGAGGLLDEVSKTKITGEEERYSHIDLVDVQANVEGAEQAFANVRPGLEQIDQDLATTIANRFDAIKNLIDRYRDAASLGGFVRYGTLTPADKKQMSAAVQALKEPLSNAAAKVAVAS